MKVGVIVFPGSNCDHDSWYAMSLVTNASVGFLWHASTDLEDCDCIVVPGGFAYGDYLRTGAIAKFAPIMQAVGHHVSRGGLVIGICNGFQILCEAGLLPGALLRNTGLKYISRYVYARVENSDTAFTNACNRGDVLRIPIGHMEGNYFCDAETLGILQRKNRVLLRYCTEKGDLSPGSNPNGSIDNIAGICNEQGNVLGLMPHPDRCSESLLGSADGAKIFRSMANAMAAI